MRRIIAGEFISVDGVVEEPGEWSMSYFTPEVGAAIGAIMATSDAMMMGRRQYEQWSEYWPTKTDADDQFAGYINNVRKYVVSSTLEEVGWNNCTLIDGSNLAKEIAELKAQPGKDIAISGSITLVESLLHEGLLDELQLILYPVVVGSGRRLLEKSSGTIPLKLVETRPLGDGPVLLSYARK
ncbi:MAG: dihydrofolate reductase family protein [Actinomycetota bacterium]